MGRESTGEADASAEQTAKVKVLVRIRPFLSNEPRQRCVSVMREEKSAEGVPNCVQLVNDKSREVLRYRFDAAYDYDTTQETIFANEINPLLESLFRGINTTIFAYGMTGAGKTYTMQGTDDNPGMIPRVASKLIAAVLQHEEADIAKLPKHVDVSSAYASVSVTSPSEMGDDSPTEPPKHLNMLHMSYLEIYNEKVYDLLKPKDVDLPIREDQAKNIFIPNLARAPIRSVTEFSETYRLGCRNRTTAATKLNAKSSRSHAILILTLTRRVYVPSAARWKTLTGKLHLIDLAGSEDNRRTDNKGLRLTESSNINKSLFVLGKVVNSLNEGSSRVPYRDSKLTRLLQDSLGGRAFGVIIANIAPGGSFWLDTYNTLNFASKSRQIVNKPVVNAVEDLPKEVIRDAVATAITASKKRKREDDDVDDGNKENDNSLNTRPRKAPRHTAAPPPQFSESQLEAKIDERLDKFKKQLLSPFLRGTGRLTRETQEKLELLERRIAQQAETEVAMAIDDDSSSDDDEEDDAGHTAKYAALGSAKPPPQTPVSKVQYTSALLRKASTLLAASDVAGALALYRMAYDVVPPNFAPQLKRKIEKLEQRLAAMETDDSSAAKSDKKAKVRAKSAKPRDEKDDDASEKSEDEAEPNPRDRKHSTSKSSRAGTRVSPMRIDSDDDDDENEEYNGSNRDDGDSDYDEEAAKDDNDDYDEDEEEERKPTKIAGGKRRSGGKRSNSSLTSSITSRSRKESIDLQSLNQTRIAEVLKILNTGSIKELKGLKEIGTKRAQSIIDYRTLHGNFTSLDDLKKVSNFGVGTLKKFVAKNISSSAD